MKTTLACLLLFLSSFTVFSANNTYKLKGQVKSKASGKPLSEVNIVINNKNFAVSDKEGNYLVDKITDKRLLIKASCVGYKSVVVSYNIDTTKTVNELPVLELKREVVNLKEVKVYGKAVPMIQKGDTIEFNVVAFKLEPNATAKQLVDALPGMSRDANNKLLFKGKEVKRVMVDDRLFFKNEVDETLKALPANIVQKVQVYDDMDELSKFTGFDSGHRYTTINLVTKYKNLKFGIGEYGAGQGTDGKYSFDTKNSLFLGASRLHISGGVNNNSSEIGEDFSRRDLYGDNKNGEIKANYNWKHKNTEIFGDYMLFTNTNDLINQDEQLYFGEDRKILSGLDKHSFSRSHKGNFEFKSYIGKRNRIIFSPEISYNTFNTISDRTYSNTFDGNIVASSDTRTLESGFNRKNGGRLSWYSLLSKKVFMINSIRANKSEKIKDKNTSGIINNSVTNTTEKWEDNSSRINYLAGLTYMFAKNQGFLFRNKFGYKGEERLKNNEYHELNYVKNKTSLGYMYKSGYKKLINLSLGYEQTRTVGSPLSRKYNSIVGSVKLKYLNNIGMHRFEYDRNATTPSLYQVYNFIDAENPLNITIGNENLKQAYNNSFSVFFPLLKTFDVYCKYNFTEDYIANVTETTQDDGIMNGIAVKKGTMVHTYTNMDDFWGATFNIRFKKPPFLTMLTMDYNFSNVPGLYNGEKNISKQHTVSINGTKFSYRNKKYNYSIGNKASYNWSDNSLMKTKNKFFRNNLGARLCFTDIKAFFIEAENDMIYDYQPGSMDKHTLRNIFCLKVGKRFCNDKLIIAAEVFDLFKDNKSISTQFQPLYIQHSIKNNLKRHFMFSIRYHFNTLKNRGGMQIKSVTLPSDDGF